MSGVERELERHDVLINQIQQRLQKLEDIGKDVGELSAKIELFTTTFSSEIESIKTDITMIKREMSELRTIINKRNGLYKWFLGSMITISIGFFGIIVALLQVLISGH